MASDRYQAPRITIDSFPFDFQGMRLEREPTFELCVVQVIAKAFLDRGEMLERGITQLPDIETVARQINTIGFDGILSDFDEVKAVLSETEMARLIPLVSQRWRIEKQLLGNG